MKMSYERNTKPKVGIFTLSSCEGCIVQILNLEETLLEILEHIDLVDCRVLGVKHVYDKLDIAFVEGCVMSKEEEEEIKKIREKTKILVALGDCACSGGKFMMKDFEISELRVSLPGGREVFRADPIDKFVKVNYYLRGCPINREEFVELVKDLLLLRLFKESPLSVCSECILREQECLIDQGYPCLGPITRGGCNAVCPYNNKICYGCRGLSEDANIDSLINIFKRRGIPVPPYLLSLKKLVISKR